VKREPIWLLREFIVAIHERLIAEYGGSAGLRDEGLLESALARPLHLFHYSKPSVVELAAAYAVGIAKNHAFIDGNKRTAFVAAAVFLSRNGLRLTAPEAEATIAMLGVAEGSMTETQFASWLKDHSKRTRGLS
jgi:death-on-curing protein